MNATWNQYGWQNTRTHTHTHIYTIYRVMNVNGAMCKALNVLCSGDGGGGGGGGRLQVRMARSVDVDSKRATLMYNVHLFWKPTTPIHSEEDALSSCILRCVHRKYICIHGFKGGILRPNKKGKKGTASESRGKNLTAASEAAFQTQETNSNQPGDKLTNVCTRRTDKT